MLHNRYVAIEQLTFFQLLLHTICSILAYLLRNLQIRSAPSRKKWRGEKSAIYFNSLKACRSAGSLGEIWRQQTAWWRGWRRVHPKRVLTREKKTPTRVPTRACCKKNSDLWATNFSRFTNLQKIKKGEFLIHKSLICDQNEIFSRTRAILFDLKWHSRQPALSQRVEL